VDIPLLGVFVNLILAAILATLTAETYVRYGEVLGNRRAFARNFMPIALTTVLIITVVKSSLALSLGLVGALSIVRFRTAIKDPEELSYLFLTIAIGLGLGADQRPLTLMATLVILSMLWIKHRQARNDEGANLYLSVSSAGARSGDPGASEMVGIESIVARLEPHCRELDLKRFDIDGQALEASFLVSVEDFHSLAACQAALQALDPDMRVVFVDQDGIGSIDA